ncbi:GNAT family N-acetyltransferase, partial [Clostridioides difficile]
KCYESQGFKIVETKVQKTHLGDGEFFVMRYQ